MTRTWSETSCILACEQRFFNFMVAPAEGPVGLGRVIEERAQKIRMQR